MSFDTRKHWLSNSVHILTVLTLLAAQVAPHTVYAATQDASFEVYPHCLQRQNKSDEWIFGPIPSPGMIAETRDIEGVRCSNFEVKDPQTLQTQPLREGDILDIDIVVDNPSKQDISHVRAWLIYDPEILEGNSVKINDAFDLVTPDENDFSSSEGYVKMDASSSGKGSNDNKILFARVQFTVKKVSPIGTPITFHDVQPGGHSIIMASDGGEETYVLKEEPGVLLVRFAQEGAADNPLPTITGDQTQGATGSQVQAETTATQDPGNIFDTAPTPPPVTTTTQPPVDPNACLRDEDCTNGTCVSGQCQATPPSALANGESCTEDSECESGICGSGICIPSLSDTQPTEPTPTPTTDPTPTADGRTAFSLLQIRNVRVTTEGSSVFLAWDHLQSSQLKGYNVYYGKTSGRYIQRRTIDKSENSLTLRSLPVGEQYFFAVRGLSSQDEESAFSREVSIVIGNPNSSTAPLSIDSLSSGNGVNPVANILENGGESSVPGETGAPSVILLFVALAAVVGTTFASKRQYIVSTSHPNA